MPEYEIFARLPCGLVVLNAQGIIEWFNAAASSLLNQELAGARWLEVINQAFAPREDDGHEVSLVDGRRVSVAISPLDSLPGELVTLTDLTTTRDYENQQHLAALGHMTAQLAHQIRTPLSSAMLYTEHLANHAADAGRSTFWINRIQACHASIEQQIRDLLIFARGDAIERSLVNLQNWGEQLHQRLRDLVSQNDVSLDVNMALPAQAFHLHDESLSGAVLNLLHNALQAGAKQIKIGLCYEAGHALQIEVSDDGCGMSPDVKAQALSPFFTTKAQGNGLGLAVVSAVVKAHRGDIRLDSSPGNGCRVTIKLPD